MVHNWLLPSHLKQRSRDQSFESTLKEEEEEEIFSFNNADYEH
jgi:hypothetical protein